LDVEIKGIGKEYGSKNGRWGKVRKM